MTEQAELKACPLEVMRSYIRGDGTMSLDRAATQALWDECQRAEDQLNTRRPADAEGKMAAIEDLRKEEGAALMLFSDNPDFGGPGCTIQVTSDWTEWKVLEFSGANLMEALRFAIEAKEREIATLDTQQTNGHSNGQSAPMLGQHDDGRQAVECRKCDDQGMRTPDDCPAGTIPPGVHKSIDTWVVDCKDCTHEQPCMVPCECQQEPSQHVNGYPCTEFIRCPECSHPQQAVVEYETGMPFPAYVHKCAACGYTIMESEWERIETGKQAGEGE